MIELPAFLRQILSLCPQQYETKKGAPDVFRSILTFHVGELHCARQHHITLFTLCTDKESYMHNCMHIYPVVMTTPVTPLSRKLLLYFLFACCIRYTAHKSGRISRKTRCTSPPICQSRLYLPVMNFGFSLSAVLILSIVQIHRPDSLKYLSIFFFLQKALKNGDFSFSHRETVC